MPESLRYPGVLETPSSSNLNNGIPNSDGEACILGVGEEDRTIPALGLKALSPHYGGTGGWD